MTDNLPSPPDGRTILVSPFSGKQDICPPDKKGRGMFMRINKQDFQVNFNNAKRGLHAFFPPSVSSMEQYYEKGHADAVRFLRKEGMYRGDSVPSVRTHRNGGSVSHSRSQSTLLTTLDSIQFETIV